MSASQRGCVKTQMRDRRMVGQLAVFDCGGDSGSASVEGFSFSWSYNEAAKTLHIQCLESSALISCSEINSRFHAEVQTCVVTANRRPLIALPMSAARI
jgi:hypothetical protein